MHSQDSSQAPDAAPRDVGRFARPDVYAAAELFVLAVAERSRPTWMPERIAALTDALTEAATDVLIDSAATFNTRVSAFDDSEHEYPRAMHDGSRTVVPGVDL